MKPWSCLLVAALLAAPVLAADKKKDDKKAKEAAAAQAAAPQAPTAEDAIKEAEAKLAAGDADGAIAVLEKAAAADGKAGLRLGTLRESRGELLPAEDAYKAAAEPKELMVIPNADHVDLYDRMDKIPFNAIAGFFDKNLKAPA
jgi:tetratricopeptide (TPR) repeat protein